MKKIFRVGILFGFSLGFFVPVGAIETQSLHLPVPVLETLPNGLTVAWFLNDSLPLVDMALLVQSGFRNDPKGKSGTAQLMSQLLDRGSRGKTALEMAQRVERLGASRYINADDDTLTMGVHGLAEDASELLEYLADVALGPDFRPEEFERERGRMLDRWMHISDYSQSLASLASHRLLASGTPYSRGGILSATELKKLKKDDVVRFYQSLFHPGNSVLMIVGRVDQVGFKKRIESLFKDWKKKSDSNEKPLERVLVKHERLLPSSTEKGLLVNRPDQSQAQIRMGFGGPLIHSPDHYALAVANAILGETFQSRLNGLIRDQLGLTYGISSQFSYNKELGMFLIGTSCRNEVVGEMITEVKKVLGTFHKKGVTQEELNSAKDYLLGAFPLRMSTLGAVASRWLSGFVYGLDRNYLNEYESKIKALDLKTVNSAIQRHFGKDLKITIAGDAKEIQKSLKKKNLGSFKQIKATDLL